jgi:adenosylcobinamide kinase/adenosylcobinamide-phosphate guanylyltransferase
MAQLTLVLGGVRSGKSQLAESLAARQPPVTYLATATIADDDMGRRIAAHRRRRPTDWHTVEEPWDVVRAVADHSAAGCVLVECVPLWLTNLVLGLAGRGPRDDQGILAEVDALAAAARDAPAWVVVVTSEVGLGLMPPDPLARRFGDLLGEANQRLAAAAAEVYACVAGIGLRLK